MVSVHIFYFCYFAFCFISICYLPHLPHSSHFCFLSSSLTYLVPFLLCRASFVLPFNIFALLCVCVWRSRKVAVSAPRPMCLLCVQNNDQTSSATVQPEFSSVQLGSARSLSSGTESRVELSSLHALCAGTLAHKGWPEKKLSELPVMFVVPNSELHQTPTLLSLEQTVRKSAVSCVERYYREPLP